MTVHNGWEAISHNGAWNDTVIVLRNRSYSAKAWHRRKHHFCRQKYLKDFCAGFRAGYEDVASGGGECTPAFPPQEYWSWEFQSAEGQARTSAWFAGYPHGARAAEEEGVGAWSQMPMSVGMQAQYQQAGTFSHQGGLYPIPDETIDGTYNTIDGTIIEPESIPAQPVPVAPSEIGDLTTELLDPIQ